MSSKTKNILIGGEAGQGLLTVGQILIRSITKSGYSVLVTQSIQSRIRGGHNTFAIHLGTKKVIAPRESVDILVALNEETAKLHVQELSSDGCAIIDENWKIEEKIDDETRLLKVPFQKWGSDKLSNISALGVVSSLLGLDQSLVAEVITDFFSSLDNVKLKQNVSMFESAYSWTREQSLSFEKLPASNYALNHLLMTGNDAIALGALTSGLKFYSFYPMTPATSIGATLAAKAEDAGIIVEQAEDEISAINMAIGASFAGAPSMVGTSGGGFALMVEGVSLAAMTETPLVIVVAQRPGPATGLPTRTEQADLEFVLHSGHGEFPRAIFAPGTIDECFYLTHKAFELAEQYQSPIFILTDHFQADSFQDTSPFNIDKLQPVKAGTDPETVSLPYNRYAITENGVSPRLIPGFSKNLVVADSDEHTEDGHITENLTVRRLMVQKRIKKIDGLINEVIPPEAQGDEKPDLLLVSWGSSKGAVREAATSLSYSGKRTATLHFSQVWPLAPDTFMNYLEEAHEVVCVEGNATGQLARLIRRETGFKIKRKVIRYDGLPITMEYILNMLSK
ncbi:MAG: 2-oxoacid:acceptor oxidoreductase subunit alpha [Spirochaetota bacterium]|nr:2-oxoacid:acceptor oxidoreductase subunit alpha [Spirochaetota bacterium]